MNYDETKTYFSFPLLRRYAKKWFNRVFFDHDVAYAKGGSLMDKITADLDCMINLNEEAYHLWEGGSFHLHQVAEAFLFSIFVFTGLTLFGWTKWKWQ